MKKLFLFDIDGTLINCGPVPKQAMNDSFLEVTGHDPDFQISDVAGLTDLFIIRRTLQKFQLDGADMEMTDRIINGYLTRLKADYPKSEGAFAFPDAIEFLSFVESQGHATALLTGNIRRGAQVKLGRFDLFDRFPFGAFGDDGLTRYDLPRVVRERAWDVLGEAFRFEEMVVVGDTVEDCKIALENGMKSVIVCRRPEWRADIEKLKPTWIGDRLDDPELLEIV